MDKPLITLMTDADMYTGETSAELLCRELDTVVYKLTLCSSVGLGAYYVCWRLTEKLSSLTQ